MKGQTITPAASPSLTLTREVPDTRTPEPHLSKGRNTMTNTVATLDRSNSQTPRVEDHL